MDGHANEAPDTGIRGLASFLTDQPEPESEDKQIDAADTQSDEDQEDESAKKDEGTDEETTEEESEESTPVESQQPRKIKVTVKGEDGADVEQEVDEPELIKGYQRQSDYTRKTQELASRESEMASLLKTKHDEFRDAYLQQAELARASMLQLAGFKTPAQMFEMSQTDPAGAVAEEHRQRAIGQMIGEIDQRINFFRQQQATEKNAALEKTKADAWQALSTEGITKEGLAKVYQDAITRYKVNPQSLDELYDPGVVLMMRDALAYRQLKEKAPEVTRKVKDAPRLPSDKSPVTRDERKEKVLMDRFRSGKAKLNDLAAYLAR